MRPLPLLALFLLAGCASQGGLAGTPRVQPTTTTIETSEGNTYTVSQIVERSIASDPIEVAPDVAWRALPEVYRELGVPVTLVDARNRMLGTTENRLSRIGAQRPSRYLDCGSGLAGQYANVYHVFVTLVTQLEPAEGGGTTVHTQLEAAARDPGHSNNPIRCTTRGVLEKEIAEALRARVAGSAR